MFNDYVVHRADMVTAWARGEDLGPDGGAIGQADRWQPWLWRALLEHVEDPARRIGDALEVLGADRPLPDTASLPRDVAIFGLSTLPPRHLDLLAGLARHTTVEWYVPTLSPGRWNSVARAVREGTTIPDARHPLLASCGRVTDDAARLVTGHHPSDDPLDDPAGADETCGSTGLDGTAVTLLGRIQQDVRADASTPFDATRLELDGTDTSVQIHRCHGPARQAEVLRDAVLGLLAQDPTLEPRDVIVLTPDVESFAPLVRAAFETDGRRPHLPVSVADRQIGRSDPVADALLAVVRLARGRVTASGVLDVLGRDPIARRAGLDHDDLSRLSGWIADTGIRWGIDEHDRARAGQPADRHHTWRAGLDRLLLGVTMADEDDRVVGDVTPYDHVEGGDVDLLGRLVAVCTGLFDAVATLRVARTPTAWVDVITTVAMDLFEVADEDRWRLHDLVESLDTIVDIDDV
ncbi:MAG: exodeoxyribonuclease V subunit gamma, partial [Nitriliruptoraceae bacterium]